MEPGVTGMAVSQVSPKAEDPDEEPDSVDVAAREADVPLALAALEEAWTPLLLETVPPLDEEELPPPLLEHAPAMPSSAMKTTRCSQDDVMGLPGTHA
jgi:hypothetical protein